MLFNSVEFLLFLATVFLVYWFVLSKHLRLQNIWLIASSFLFYGWWDWRFLLLMIGSASIDFIAAIQIEKQQDKKVKKRWLALSLLSNLIILFFFKYFNFFSESFTLAFQSIGIHIDPFTLQVILPLGISFYTFQAMGYGIDVYRKKIKATHDPFLYFGFISFFPQLVAGPIERASHLLSQFEKPRTFNTLMATDGLRQILWGFFKKCVIADNVAPFVAIIFDQYEELPASTLVVGVIYFAIQIYADFSGYSDIAIGTARLFGFTLMRNFAFPYFSTSMYEFWKRWHISLTSWFRDYVFISLGGNQISKARTLLNIMAVFALSGLWHGANYTFILWGICHGLLYIPSYLHSKQNKPSMKKNPQWLSNGITIAKMAGTFFCVCVCWIFFRAENVSIAFDFMKNLIDKSLFQIPHDTGLKTILPFILLLFTVEWLNRDKQHGLQFPAYFSTAIRWVIYIWICTLILLFGNFNKTEFIYFAF